MRKKGFTLVELLIVISIIALLMAILMPALNRVRQMAYKMMCASNLSGIGKSMLIYSNENEEEYPRAGGRRALWETTGTIQEWTAQSEQDAFGGRSQREATITSSFYLLVRWYDVTPKNFTCNGDSGHKIFKLSDAGTGLPNWVNNLEDVWDFGSWSINKTPYFPGEYVSYSYHMPYDQSSSIRGWPISTVSNPIAPLCADRNPWLDRNAGSYVAGNPPNTNADPDEGPATWLISTATGTGTSGPTGQYYDPDKTENSASHLREGQNVLFNDSHVNFEKTPNCGVEQDNIWKSWEQTGGEDYDAEEREVGEPGETGSAPVRNVGSDPSRAPQSEDDACLVNEYNGDPQADLPLY
ncbi:MAG: type II secretion system protein [Planctomycetota bacterium]|jgi:prepilin-type N-terminal cleavage/methylation domain-containing protein